MTDPLSITAGVVGILNAATHASSLLYKWIKSAKEAPQQAEAAWVEINEIRGILCSLQSLLLGNGLLQQSGASILQVDQLVVTISGCVLTFPELEKLLERVKVENRDILDRIKWINNQSTVAVLIQRLQYRKGR